MNLSRGILEGLLIFLLSNSYIFIIGQDTVVHDLRSDSLLIENQSLFYCDIQLPENYHVENSYTLVIGLHGGGGSFETFRKIKEKFENTPFILATPEAPYKWQLGDKIGYDWAAWPSGDFTFMKKAIVLTSTYVETIIQSLKNKYKIKDVYLLGFSQGSIVAQIAGIENHTLLSGIVILSGPELNHPGKPEIVWPSDKTVRSAKQLKVFIAHGTSDQIVEIETARKSKDQYARFGYDVTLFEFEGGHEISTAALREVEKWIDSF